MAQIKVLTNSKRDGKPVVVAGSQIHVGSEQIERVVDVQLEADLGGLWKLQVTVLVDPNTLFDVLPPQL